MKNKKINYLISFFKHGFFVFFFCYSIGCSNSDAVVVISGDTIIAEVNNVDITVDKLRDETKFLIIQFRINNKNALSKEEKLLLKIKGLNRVIRNNLLSIEAVSNGISLTRDEFEIAFRNIESGYEDDSFWTYLNVHDIPPDLWKNRLKNNLLIKKFIDTKFVVNNSANELKAKKYYEVHKERFKKGRMIHALHIMVATEDEAKIIYGSIKSGKKNFSELVDIYSLAPDAAMGGNLGYFEVDQMPEEFNKIGNLKKNQISEVITTPYGHHIFKIVDIKAPKQLSFIESKDEIFDQFSRDEQSAVFEKWLLELKNNSNIKINEDVLSKVTL
jgi:peptidyl-prolyl cis-trans isomerase C